MAPEAPTTAPPARCSSPEAPVKGGFYGEEPSLTDLDNGDLKATTDFRDVYSELLSKTLQTDPTPSVGAGRRGLGFL